MLVVGYLTNLLLCSTICCTFLCVRYYSSFWGYRCEHTQSCSHGAYVLWVETEMKQVQTVISAVKKANQSNGRESVRGWGSWEAVSDWIVVQLLSCVQLFVTPWTAACQASLSITNSQNLLKLMSIEFMMPSSHLTLCHTLFLLPSIFPSFRVFSNESDWVVQSKFRSFPWGASSELKPELWG